MTQKPKLDSQERDMTCTNRNQGFSLMELMIVLVIVAVLSAVAYPSYHRHLRTAERQMAQAALMAFGQAMERARLRHPLGAYPNPEPGYPPPADRDAANRPLRLETIYPLDIPTDQNIKRWRLGLSRRTPQHFRLYANPLPSSGQKGCLVYESTGRRCYVPRSNDCSALDCNTSPSQHWN